MRFGNSIIQDKNISERTASNFVAKYKGKEIIISDNHGFGKPDEWWLTRFIIDVYDIKTGMVDVQTYEDCHEISEAVIIALKGAMVYS